MRTCLCSFRQFAIGSAFIQAQYYFILALIKAESARRRSHAHKNPIRYPHTVATATATAIGIASASAATAVAEEEASRRDLSISRLRRSHLPTYMTDTLRWHA